jgi:hypothetical protein
MLRVEMMHRKKKTSSTDEVTQSRPGNRAGRQTTACRSLRNYSQRNTPKYEVLAWSKTTNCVIKT